MGSVLKLKIFKISTTKNFAKGSVKVVIASSMNLKEIENGSIDVAFANNFFEHLSKEDVVYSPKKFDFKYLQTTNGLRQTNREEGKVHRATQEKRKEQQRDSV